MEAIFNWVSQNTTLVGWGGSLLLTAGVTYLATKFVPHSTCAVHRKSAEKSAAEKLTEALGKSATTADIHALALQVQGTAARIDTMQEQLRGYGEVLNIVKEQGTRMNSYLLERGR